MELGETVQGEGGPHPRNAAGCPSPSGGSLERLPVWGPRPGPGVGASGCEARVPVPQGPGPRTLQAEGAGIRPSAHARRPLIA